MNWGRLQSDKRLILALLAVLFLVVWVWRYLTLASAPFPPSEDVAGELYTLHAWEGSQLPQMGGGPLPSVVYVFLILYTPLNLFPTFMGMDIYMSLVGALIIFPAYILSREIGLRTEWAMVSAALFGTASAYSLMLTWNAGSNLFGITVLLLFLNCLVRWLKKPERRSALWTALSFGILAGTHPVTFLFGAFDLGIVLFFFVATRFGTGMEVLRPTAVLVGGSVLAFLPSVPVYASMFSASANTGVGQYGANLTSYYGTALQFAWGIPQSSFSAIATIDIALVLLGLIVLSRVVKVPSSRVTLLATIIGPVFFPILQASNAVRAAYYLPIPSILLVCCFFQWLISFRVRIRKVRPPSRSKMQWSLSRAMNRRNRPALAGGFAIVALSVCLVNVANSNTVFSQGVTYYQEINQDDVNAMNWIHQNVPSGETVFDGIGLGTWLEGYAGRFAYSPTPLGSQITTRSYQSALIADEISLGSYIVGTNQILFSQSPPSSLQSPEIFAVAPGYWVPLVFADADSLIFNVTVTGGQIETPELGWIDNLINATGGSTPGGGWEKFVFWSSSWHLGVTEAIIVDGGSTSITWSSPNATLNSVTMGLAMPPSGYYFDYSSIDSSRSTSLLTISLELNGASPLLEFAGGEFEAETQASGWTYVSFVGGTTLNITLSGAKQLNDPISGYLVTSSLWGANQIRFALVDFTRGTYGFPQRVDLDALGGNLTAALAYSSGTVEVYSVSTMLRGQSNVASVTFHDRS